MAKLASAFGFLLAFFTALPSAAAQQAPTSDSAKRPQLKLEVIPLKKTYTVGETVVVRYRLMSLEDGTLCFPPPAIEESGTFEGYVSLKARPLNNAGDQDFFIHDVWPMHPTEEEVRSDVADRWIKLGMSEPYRLRKPDKMALSSPGEWELQATYHPPGLTARDKDIVRSMGCTPPDVPVLSEPLTIAVVNPSN
jgi:hypothetical protein